MIYTPMTIKAMKIAYDAHQGQVDQSGVPYIFHPIHVAEQMEDELSCTVALLHDVVEDTSVTFEELEEEFPKPVIEALRLLTHDKATPYTEYVKNTMTNEVAYKVKIADVKHNSDETRTMYTDCPEEKLLHWRNKYKQAMQLLKIVSSDV